MYLEMCLFLFIDSSGCTQIYILFALEISLINLRYINIFGYVLMQFKDISNYNRNISYSIRYLELWLLRDISNSKYISIIEFEISVIRIEK